MAYIKLKEIEVKTETQVREKICQSTVDEYAKAMQEGSSFPPIELIAEGPIYLIADGHHRYEAAKKIGQETIEANLRDGSVRDAILIGLAANHNHGLRLNLRDRRRMVSILLMDNEWREWSNAEIAKQCTCSVELVAKLRSELGAEKDITSCIRKGKHIKIRTPSQVIVKQQQVYPSEIGLINEHDVNLKEIEIEEQRDALQLLISENARLSDKLAMQSYVGTEEEKLSVQAIIRELREELKLLNAELKIVTISRNSFQADGVEMHRQLNRLTRQRKKCTCKNKLEQAA